MKNSYLTIGFIIGTIFSIKVSASDTLSVNTSALTPVNDILTDESKQERERKLLSDTGTLPPGTNVSKHSFHRAENATNLQNEKTMNDSTKSNALLNYIESYDINANRVYPKPARVISPDEELDFPKMNPLFMPLVFNNIHREYKLSLYDKKEPEQCFNSEYLDSIKETTRSYNWISNISQSILLSAESQQIGHIKYDKSKLPQPEKMIYFMNTRRQSQWMKNNVSLPNRDADTKDLPKTEYNPWTKNVNVKLQFSQTYNSHNWSRGGESNMAGLSTIYMEANYSNLKNIQFDNNVEAKIGLNTVSSDTLRNLNISTDQLRAVTKLGIRMHNDFYYSLAGEFTTQFLNNYRPNTMDLRSSFLSPAKLFVGLGVDYKKSGKKNKYNLSVLLTPLTAKMSYLYDIDHFKGSDYGIDPGKHLNCEWGSKLAATLYWKISEQMQFRSNFYYFTDFSYIDTDWENTLDMNFNNYFATSVYFHLKLDDRLKRPPGESLIQMQELFSFGMVYHW